jgi:hypothetical protein
MRLAERLRIDLFAERVRIAGQQIQLSACFAVASSNNRSPIVVLREMEAALQSARANGPWAILASDQVAHEAALLIGPTHPDHIAIEQAATQPQREELWSTANESSGAS